MTIPQFFRQHGLPADADERLVKRTYARQLKNIDQEADLAGFQALRESYEAALAWLTRRASEQSKRDASLTADDVGRAQQEIDLRKNRQAAEIIATTAADVGAPVSEIPSGQALPLSDDPGVMAKQVLEEMLEDMRARQHDQTYTEIRFAQALDDERLIHMDARRLFEQFIAAYLLQGWQLGNGELFQNATEFFGWKTDARRLLILGKAGGILDQALLEQAEFEKSNVAAHGAEWDLLRRAREERSPDPLYLEKNFSLLLHLIERYPTWTALVSSRKNLEHWCLVYDAQQQSAMAADRQTGNEPFVPMAERPYFNIKIWSGFFGCFMLLMILGGLISTKTSTDKPVYRPITEPMPYTEYSPALKTISPSSPGTINAPFSMPAPAQTAVPDINVNQATASQLYEFGNQYMEKQGNLLQAMHYWTLASGKGNAAASYKLAWTYDAGNGGMRDSTLAYKWYAIAADQGHVESQNRLGDYYYFGMHGVTNMDKAFHYYEMAARNGVPRAQVQLAAMYDQGQGVAPNPKKVLPLLQSAAKSNHAGAEANLGNFYLTGAHGLPKDVAKAVYWLKKSADQDNVMAQRLLASVHEYGLGKYPVDLNEAGKWYRKAASLGDTEANAKMKNLCRSLVSPECSNF